MSENVIIVFKSDTRPSYHCCLLFDQTNLMIFYFHLLYFRSSFQNLPFPGLSPRFCF